MIIYCEVTLLSNCTHSDINIELRVTQIFDVIWQCFSFPIFIVVV